MTDHLETLIQRAQTSDSHRSQLWLALEDHLNISISDVEFAALQTEDQIRVFIAAKRASKSSMSSLGHRTSVGSFTSFMPSAESYRR